MWIDKKKAGTHKYKNQTNKKLVFFGTFFSTRFFCYRSVSFDFLIKIKTADSNRYSGWDRPSYKMVFEWLALRYGSCLLGWMRINSLQEVINGVRCVVGLVAEHTFVIIIIHGRPLSTSSLLSKRFFLRRDTLFFAQFSGFRWAGKRFTTTATSS